MVDVNGGLVAVAFDRLRNTQRSLDLALTLRVCALADLGHHDSIAFEVKRAKGLRWPASRAHKHYQLVHRDIEPARLALLQNNIVLLDRFIVLCPNLDDVSTCRESFKAKLTLLGG